MIEVIFILDRSASMSGLEKDTICGFNLMLEKQKEEPGDILVSTILFDNYIEYIHNRVPLNKVKPLTEEQYYVRGSTSLLDAVGTAIHHCSSFRKLFDKANLVEKTLVIIITDGMENSSKEYSYEMVRRMIELKTEKYNWEFLFLGANIDAAKEAKHLGIAPSKAADYICDETGTAINFNTIGNAVSCFRSQGFIQSDWKQGIDADFKKRKRGIHL